MVMALSLFWLYKSLFLVAGYENGLAVVARRRGDGSWDILYKHQAHSQPILSLDVSPNREYFLTSGADAIIAKHPIPNMNLAGPIPVGTKTEMPETTTDREASPLKTIKTKHSGQQGLQIRSDGRIFATAGWDSKIRVYSAKSMAELAVLKWHDVGCYAAAFSVLADDRKDASDGSKDIARKGTVRQPTELLDDSNVMKGNEMAMTTTVRAAELNVKDRRIKMAKEAHWLAAGSKDGKISLWDIY
jgi:WD40 repeat protein